MLTYLITVHGRYRQTEGQTDRQTGLLWQYRDLHWSASRSKSKDR